MNDIFMNCFLSSSICSGTNYVERIRDYCLRIAPEYARPPADRETIRGGSKCKEITIHFEGNEYDLTPRLIGLCFLNPQVSKCISKGEGEAEMIVYDYDPQGKVCYPRFIKDDFLVLTADKNETSNCCNIL